MIDVPPQIQINKHAVRNRCVGIHGAPVVGYGPNPDLIEAFQVIL